MRPVLIAVVAIIGLWALHRFLSYAEDRGWIYYRKKRGSFGGLGVTSDFLNMYDPSRRNMQAVVRVAEWKREEDDDGDGDDPRLHFALREAAQDHGKDEEKSRADDLP